MNSMQFCIIIAYFVKEGIVVSSERFRKYIFSYRQIYLSGRIELSLEQYICSSIAQLKQISQKPITMFIHSYGGCIQSTLRIYRTVLDAGNVDGYIIGDAFSGAAIILQACRKRKALQQKDVNIFMHDPVIIDDKDKENAYIYKFLEEQKIIMYNILSQRSGISIAEIIGLCKKNTHMNAQEALQLGFIDKITKAL